MSLEASLRPAVSARPTEDLPDEERLAAADERAWQDLLARISRQSVTKHFEAYVDVPWDDPEYAIDRADPRFALPVTDALGATDWYQAQPEATRAAIGLHMLTTFLKIGVQFESTLKRGLLEYTARLPNGSAEFRYLYHEVIEEAQHSLMFQEFVNRTGLDVDGLPAYARFFARGLPRLASRFPELFFIFVLGGEDPIDHVQRGELHRGDRWAHPLVRRISQIHVIEEARHLSFARAYLRRNVPKLGFVKRQLLRLRTPLILGNMAGLMMQPSAQVVREYGIPREVLREAYRGNRIYAKARFDALGKTRALCAELGLIQAPWSALWRHFGLLRS
jgi:hypothetical protein